MAYLHPHRMEVRGSAVMGGGPIRFVVPKRLLADFINPIIERKEKHQREFYGIDTTHGTGVVNIIACEAAAMMGKSDEAALRRLYDARHAEGSICAEWAEAFLQALDYTLDETPIPIFPSSLSASEEMAEVWADDEIQRKKLNTALYRFAIGFQADLDQLCDEIEERMQPTTVAA